MRKTIKPITIIPKIDAIALFLSLSDILPHKCIVKNVIIVTPRPIRMYLGIFFSNRGTVYHFRFHHMHIVLEYLKII